MASRTAVATIRYTPGHFLGCYCQVQQSLSPINRKIAQFLTGLTADRRQIEPITQPAAYIWGNNAYVHEVTDNALGA